MPSEIYGTLYNQHDLNTVITMVKDIYAKKPELANPPATTRGVAAPFTLIKAPNGSSKRVHFQEGESLSDTIDKLTETCIEWTWRENPQRSCTNHTSQAPGVKEEEVDLGPGEVALVVTKVKDGPGRKVDLEVEEEDSPIEEDPREGSLIKAALQRDPMYPAKLKTKTRTDVTIAIRGDTLQQCKQLKFIRFLILSCPKRALVWGNCHERLHVEIFVRVLRSSEVISLILCK